ncbi:hypothetical protein P5V15_001240 [Pogonomyrmex californicus]
MLPLRFCCALVAFLLRELADLDINNEMCERTLKIEVSSDWLSLPVGDVGLIVWTSTGKCVRTSASRVRPMIGHGESRRRKQRASKTCGYVCISMGGVEKVALRCVALRVHFTSSVTTL